MSVKVSIINEEVVDLDFSSQVATSASGNKFQANYFMLFIGDESAKVFPHLEGKPGFYPSFIEFRDRVLEEVPLDASVLIIGTRLSSLDCVAALRERKHKGKMVMASRSGLLPGTNRELVMQPLQHFDGNFEEGKDVKGEDLVRMLEMEMSSFFEKKIVLKDFIG